jgi:ADP-ribosyl-[dinitrogen reductase] hydrolase
MDGAVSGVDAALEAETLALVARLRGRFQGALVGLAVGEALAAPAVFGRPGSFAPVRDLLGGGPHDLPRGAWGDDTAMALCVARSLVACDGCDPGDQLARYRRWQRDGEGSATGECLGIGAGTARALVDGRPDGALPDGAESLARTVPLAMRHWADAEALQAAVRATTGVTCHEPATFDAAARCAAALLAALRGAPPGDIMDAVADAGADASAAPAALPTAAAAASPTAVLAAAARAFAGGAGWKDAVLRAVNLGGPADALGALTGALAGAHFGIEAIPAAWRGALAQRGEIEELADRLLADALVGLAS